MSDQTDKLAKVIWDYMLMHQELKLMDAIFVLGSNDTRVAEYASDLYFRGLGQYVICAGGNGKESDFLKPEAEVFSEIILAKGVPEEKIIIENKSTNTGENILFVKRLVEEKKLGLTSFLLVQKPYMERRAFATFRKQWQEAKCLVTSPPITYEEYSKDEMFKKRFINVMVGDLQRIRDYPKLGFQITQEIPKEVSHAWEKLVQLGYDKYLLT